MDIKVVTQQKKTALQSLGQQLNYADDLLCEPRESIPLQQMHTGCQRLGSIQLANSRILIVDDSDENRKLLVIFLGQYGCDVVSVNNGHEAWYLLLKEHFDLVLTDICMPGLNGNDLANQIKNRKKTLPIIAVTGSTWLAGDSFDEIIAKPVWLHALLNSIKFQLAKASVLSQMDAEGRK